MDARRRSRAATPVSPTRGIMPTRRGPGRGLRVSPSACARSRRPASAPGTAPRAAAGPWCRPQGPKSPS